MVFKTTFKRNKTGGISIHFDGMTQGKAIALCNALSQHCKSSPVGQDVLLSLHNAIQGETSQEFKEENQELYACSYC